MNNEGRKQQFLIKFRINRTRNGNALKLFTADGTNKAFSQSGIVVDGITDVEELRRAVKTQLDWIVEDVVEEFTGTISDAKKRIEAIRVKERNYMRAQRQVTVDGGVNPEQETSDANL